MSIVIHSHKYKLTHVLLLLLTGAMESFKIYVQSRVDQIEVGECDDDHISLITLIHEICEKLSGCSDVPTGEYHVWA